VNVDLNELDRLEASIDRLVLADLRKRHGDDANDPFNTTLPIALAEQSPLSPLHFASSAPLTLGVELELMILNRDDYNLTTGVSDLLKLANKATHPGDIKPEITQSMIEVSTDICADAEQVERELRAIRSVLVTSANKLDLAIAGGGAHPFQRWADRRIYPKPRYEAVYDQYGYLAKQFTVFGQHIHIGCTSANIALELTHRFARYMPHFIALAAASPHYQGIDTGFDCSRLTTVAAFPMSGSCPLVYEWSDFLKYFDRLRALGVVESMKDFYWDIRPKPEFGTIEIRVCDTPLTVQLASDLAAYAQALALLLLRTAAPLPTQHTYDVYRYNRFQACRYGYAGEVIVDVDHARNLSSDAIGRRVTIQQDIVATIDELSAIGEELGCELQLQRLAQAARSCVNGAWWLRQTMTAGSSLSDTMQASASQWMAG
jgi:glutamate---cysteine ligase / carboxylate-amine ligase